VPVCCFAMRLACCTSTTRYLTRCHALHVHLFGESIVQWSFSCCYGAPNTHIQHTIKEQRSLLCRHGDYLQFRTLLSTPQLTDIDLPRATPIVPMCLSPTVVHEFMTIPGIFVIRRLLRPNGVSCVSSASAYTFEERRVIKAAT
jgi:hypothetical protein